MYRRPFSLGTSEEWDISHEGVVGGVAPRRSYFGARVRDAEKLSSPLRFFFKLKDEFQFKGGGDITPQIVY